MEIGLAPECVHTDPREKRYYLMKRFVLAVCNAGAAFAVYRISHNKK